MLLLLNKCFMSKFSIFRMYVETGQNIVIAVPGILGYVIVMSMKQPAMVLPNLPWELLGKNARFS